MFDSNQPDQYFPTATLEQEEELRERVSNQKTPTASHIVATHMLEQIISAWSPDVRAKLTALREESSVHTALPDGYLSYLASKQWKAHRETILDAYGRRCSVCFNTNDLHAHHRNYSEFGKETPASCLLLCLRCHAFVHYRGQLPQQWLKAKHRDIADEFAGLSWDDLIVKARDRQWNTNTYMNIFVSVALDILRSTSGKTGWGGQIEHE